MENTYDVVVVGGGPAGLSGAKIIARMRRKVLVIDAGAPRNAPAEGVHNYLYAEGATPSALAATGRAEALAYGVDLVDGAAVRAVVVPDPQPGAARFRIDVRAGNGSVSTVGARRVLLATGLVDVLPDIPGLRERWGQDVLHCPFCHGWEVRDQPIGVIGTGSMALHAVLLFRSLSADVIYFQHTAPDPSDDQREQLDALGVQHRVGGVAAVETTGDVLAGVRMTDGRLVPRTAVAVAPVVNGRDDLVVDLGLSTTDLEMGGDVLGRYLTADPSGATTTPGVWAAGNLSAPMAQVVGAAAAGAAAGASMHLDLVTEDTAVAVTAHRAAHAVGASR